jgi:hypothetical protein
MRSMSRSTASPASERAEGLVPRMSPLEMEDHSSLEVSKRWRSFKSTAGDAVAVAEGHVVLDRNAGDSGGRSNSRRKLRAKIDASLLKKQKSPKTVKVCRRFPPKTKMLSPLMTTELARRGEGGRPETIFLRKRKKLDYR